MPAQGGQRLTHLGVELAAGTAALQVVLVKAAHAERQAFAGAHRGVRHFPAERQRLDQQLARPVANPVIDLLLRDFGQGKVAQGVVDGVKDLRRGLDQGAVQVK